jgi:hypothetical protein
LFGWAAVVPESASGGSATSTRERFAWPERISTAVLIGAAAMFCKAWRVFVSLGGGVGTAVFVERFFFYLIFIERFGK